MDNQPLSKQDLANVKMIQEWYCVVFYSPMVQPDDGGEVIPPTEHVVYANSATEAADKLHADHPNAIQINCTKNRK